MRDDLEAILLNYLSVNFLLIYSSGRYSITNYGSEKIVLKSETFRTFVSLYTSNLEAG